MKRFFCVLFACMLVLGAAMAIYGYQNGASTSLYWSDGHVYTEKEFDSLAESEEWTELPEGVSGLALELNNADVTIRQGDVFHISADYQRGSAPEATVENGVLRLRDEASAHIGFGFSLGPSHKENTVTIELPEGALTALDILTGVGDLSLEDVHLETLTVEMDMGSAALKDVSCDRLSVQCNLGDFTLEGGEFGTAELTMNMGSLAFSGAVRTAMRAQSDMGDVDLSGALAGEIEVNANLGTVSIDSQLPRSAYALDLGTDLGNLTVDGERIGTDSISPSLQQEEGENSLRVRADMGDIFVQFGAKK